MNFRSIVVLGVAVCLACAAAFSQGIYMEAKSTGGPLGNNEIISKTYIMPKMIRADGTGQNQSMIFRMDKQLIYEVYPDEQAYSQMTFDEWDALMKKANVQMNAQMAEMKKHMSQMPPEQQKMIKQLMGGEGTKVDVEKTGETKSIAGYACTKYVVKQDGKELLTVYATDAIKSFAPMRKDFESFSKRTLANAAGAMKNLATAYQKINGLPMAMEFSGVHQECQKVEQKAIPMSEFEPPAGYKKVESKMKQQLEQAGQGR